jgi:hypothetical protein
LSARPCTEFRRPSIRFVATCVGIAEAKSLQTDLWRSRVHRARASHTHRHACERQRGANHLSRSRQQTIVRNGHVIELPAGNTNVATGNALPNDASLTVHQLARGMRKPILRPFGRPAGRRSRLPLGAGSTGATALLWIPRLKACLSFFRACSFDITKASPPTKQRKPRATAPCLGKQTTRCRDDLENLSTSALFIVAPASAIDYLIVEADVIADRVSAINSACSQEIVAKA